MSFLVTGGAGFIGSAVVDLLLAAGESVVSVDDLRYAGSLENLALASRNPRHRLVQADVCDTARLRALVAEVRPRAILHLAAETHVDRSLDDPGAFVTSNIVGTSSMLEAALAYWQTLDATAQGQFRFVQVSTDEVFGELGPRGFFTESSPYRPSSPYAASKAAADHLVRAWHRSFGLPVIVSNCGNNYGPRQFPEKLIPLTLLRAFEGRSLPVYGRGDNVRDWIWVGDHAAALYALALRGRAGETYAVGARNEQRNIEIVRQLCAVLDRLAPAAKPRARLIEFVADRPGHDFRYAIDPYKIETELGWQPRMPFDEGLRETARWYLANREWCARTAATYGQERLGLRQTA